MVLACTCTCMILKTFPKKKVLFMSVSKMCALEKTDAHKTELLV